MRFIETKFLLTTTPLLDLIHMMAILSATATWILHLQLPIPIDRVNKDI